MSSKTAKRYNKISVYLDPEMKSKVISAAESSPMQPTASQFAAYLISLGMTVHEDRELSDLVKSRMTKRD